MPIRRPTARGQLRDLKTTLLLLPAILIASGASAADLRLGIIGCDTSHVTAFTEALNDPSSPGHVAGGKVVAAFRGGSKDVQSSWSRVEQYSTTLKAKYGVIFYDSIQDFCQQ